MNAAQRRVFRRALSAATGIVAGTTLQRMGKFATVEAVSPTGGRNVRVKHKNNVRSLWPVNELTSIAGFATT